MQREEKDGEYKSGEVVYLIFLISNIRQERKQHIGVEKQLIHSQHIFSAVHLP